MRYTQITDAQTRQMLDAIGVESVESLFAPVTADIRFRGVLNIPPGVSELELFRDLDQLARKNRSTDELVCFLGGGAYDHFVPALVDGLAAQTEFVTGYTPYQAEASQGILQLFYEFQSMVCALTGMDVANASLYESASAAAEAMMMATSTNKRDQVVIAANVHPDIRRVVSTYAAERGMQVAIASAPDGVVDERGLAEILSDQTSAMILQSPNFYGCLERIDRLAPMIKDAGAVSIVSTDPIACGLLKPPGAFDVDIVIAEGQPLGIPLLYGGPYLGLLACKEPFLRKIPGRVVGMTNDADGRRGFCLALQTREQHIKRERATSNVCTNQGLLAVRAAIYMAAMGKQGIKKVASLCFEKAHYAASEIAKIDGYSLRFKGPFFKEFVVKTTRDVKRVMLACRGRQILAGVPMAQFDSSLSDCFLIAVTEKRTKDEIDELVAALKVA